MKIVKEYPPIYDAIIATGLMPSPTTVYTYGDILYNPSGNEIPDHLMVHEETHTRQQGNAVDAWWNRYLNDPYFRVSQEVEAYANQFNFICKNYVKDRNKQNLVLRDMAMFLSSPMYGAVIGHNSAISMIRQKANARPL